MPTDAVAHDPAASRTPVRRELAGQTSTVLFHTRPDGTVTAHARGFTGVGRSILDALADLEREMEAAPSRR